MAGIATCSDTFAGVGSHSITAIYSGDADFLASTSAPLTQTVGQDATTTALSSSANPSVSGQVVTFTATVTANPPGSGTPTGTVDFQDGGVSIAGCGAQALVAGIATCGVTYAGVGSHSITAIYSGDPDFLPSTSATLTQTVNQDATTTTVTSSVNPSVSGQSVTYTATVMANAPGSGTPTGTVTFQDGGVDIAGCVNQAMVAGSRHLQRQLRGVGSHSITAIYSGDPDFLTSTSAPLTQTVGQDATTTALSSSANPSVAGQVVTFTATVTANPPGAGDTDGDGDLPGRRGQHRRLYQPGPWWPASPPATTASLGWAATASPPSTAVTPTSGQHLGPADPDGRSGCDDDGAQLLGQPLGGRSGRHLHGHGDRQPTGRGDTDGDGDLPGRRGQHRRLRSAGPGGRHRHLQRQLRGGGQPQHHRHLQR